MPNILIIEDDPAISALIAAALKREHCTCTQAMDGREGAEASENGHYDLILLDLMLPEISGYELLEYFRTSDVPVIIISAMGRVDDRIRGLRMGADDYLIKPFQVGELTARVASVLRRSGKQDRILTAGDLTVDTASRTVCKGGREIALTVKEFDLLVELLRRKNVALSRAFLYEAVWQEEYTGRTRTLDNHIQRLRQKLDLNEQIQTVFRIGYRFRE